MLNLLSVLQVIFGGALLVIGRRLFWLFVGAIGFIVGVEIALRLFHGNELFTVMAGLALGVMFALLAIFVESIAIGLAGFLGGGYVGLSLAALLGMKGSALQAIAFIVGGIVGVILVIALFEWALITISSLAGASMVLAGLHLGPAAAGGAFLILLLAGVIIQGLSMRRETEPPRRPRRAHRALSI